MACISLLGVVVIVGSGGGSLGFPPCESKTVCADNPPPSPAASMSPTWYTALVGSPASFTVTTVHVAGTLSYQWHRSSDGGASYVEIAGATSASYAIPSVNLADDKTAFRADVRVDGVPTFSVVAFLAVSSVPGVVFQDDEFLAANWLASPVPGDTGALPAHLEESLATGGNPGPFRKMTFQVPAGSGSARVFYSSLASTYDPATQGAVYVIDYSEDCIDLPPGYPGSTLSSLVIEQGGRRFLSNTSDGCICHHLAHRGGSGQPRSRRLPSVRRPGLRRRRDLSRLLGRRRTDALRLLAHLVRRARRVDRPRDRQLEGHGMEALAAEGSGSAAPQPMQVRFFPVRLAS